MNNFLFELKSRNIIDNLTNETKILEAIKRKKSIYIGFDPSGPSIHLGNYVVINVLNLAQKYEIDVVAIIGGTTGGIGDPSGKKSERILLEKNIVEKNAMAIKSQIQSLLPNAKIINNSDFYKNVNLIDFLRDTGKYINVSYMINKEIVKNRIDDGISFTEFCYSLIQANDFYQLYENHNVGIQIGGADQWGNITTGIELIRKKTSNDIVASGITIKLLLKNDGTKFGKTEEGAIYLDPHFTSPYKMYQFLINQNDEDVENLLNFLSSYSLEEINKIMKVHNENPKLKYAQLKLSENIITKIHGIKYFETLNKISESLFKNDLSSLNKEELSIVLKEIPNIKYEYLLNESIIDLLVNSKIAPSKREAKMWIAQGGIRIGQNNVQDPNYLINKNDLILGEIIIKKGKKEYFLITKNK